MLKLSVKGILFDIGNTLIDASKIMDQALEKAANKLLSNGYISNIDKFKSAYKKINETIQGSHINHLFSDIKIIKSTWQELGFSTSYSAFGIFLVEFRNYVRSKIKVDKKLVHLLKSLKEKDIRLGIVSDGTVIEQLETLTYLGIIEFLDVIIISEEFEVEKPSSILFEKALQELKLEAQDVMMVGDDLNRDIIGARNLGIKTVLITQFLRKAPPDITTKMVDVTIEKIQDVMRLV